jgi:hypothetical protein
MSSKAAPIGGSLIPLEALCLRLSEPGPVEPTARPKTSRRRQKTKLTVQARSPCELCSLNTLAPDPSTEFLRQQPVIRSAEVARVEAPSRNEGRSGLTFARKRSSQRTQRWREMDSNRRSLSRMSRLCCGRGIAGMVVRGQSRKALSLLRGTEGSNPSPSSGESAANLKSNTIAAVGVAFVDLPLAIEPHPKFSSQRIAVV